MTEDGDDGRIKSVIELAREKAREKQKMREGEEPGGFKQRLGDPRHKLICSYSTGYLASVHCLPEFGDRSSVLEGAPTG